MFETMMRAYSFGKRIYAHNKWWTQIEFVTINDKGKSTFYAIEGTTAPAIIHIVIQTEEDKKYQEILFRKFK